MPFYLRICARKDKGMLQRLDEKPPRLRKTSARTQTKVAKTLQLSGKYPAKSWQKASTAPDAPAPKYKTGHGNP